MPLGQNLKLRAALGTGTTAATGQFSTTQYLVGGSAGRIRQWTQASFTIAALVRIANVATTQKVFTNEAATAGFNLTIEAAGNARVLLVDAAGGTITTSVAVTASDVNKDALFVFSNYSNVARQLTVNGRRVGTSVAAMNAPSAAATGVPFIGVSNVPSQPWLGGIYDIAICYSKAIAAADQQAFFEQTVEEAGIPSSCMGTRWDHFMRAESFSGRVGVSQAQLPDVAGGVNFKLAGTAVGSPSTLALSPLRALSFGPTG